MKLGSVAQKFAARPRLWFLLGALVFLYLHLFIPPRTPIWRGGDQTIHLLNAMRMRDGQVIYRDFFQFILPGTELVYLALFKVFGLRVWIPNLMLIILGLGVAWLGLVISKKVMSGWTACLPSALFLTFAFANSLNATHHWYSALMVAAALAVLIEERSPPRLIEAAAFCGLAACFTQTRGLMAVLGLAVFLLWERRRQGQSWRSLISVVALLFVTFLTVIVAVNGYFIWKAGLKRFLDDTVVFAFRYYPKFTTATNLRIYMIGLPAVRAWYHLPRLGVYLFMHALIPLVYLIFFIRHGREAKARPFEPWDRLMLLSIMGLFQFVGVASSPSFFRLSTASLPAWILLVWFLNSRRRLHQVLLGLLGLAALALTVVGPWRTQIHWRAYLDLPTGRTAIFEPLWLDKLDWLVRQTRPSEFFLEAEYSDVYFSLRLRSPARVPFVTPTDYTRPEQVVDVIEGLEKHRVRYVLWTVRLDVPAENGAKADHLSPLRAYLRNRYHVVKTFADAAQIWERNQ